MKLQRGPSKKWVVCHWVIAAPKNPSKKGGSYDHDNIASESDKRRSRSIINPTFRNHSTDTPEIKNTSKKPHPNVSRRILQKFSLVHNLAPINRDRRRSRHWRA